MRVANDQTHRHAICFAVETAIAFRENDCYNDKGNRAVLETGGA